MCCISFLHPSIINISIYECRSSDEDYDDQEENSCAGSNSCTGAETGGGSSCGSTTGGRSRVKKNRRSNKKHNQVFEPLPILDGMEAAAAIQQPLLEESTAANQSIENNDLFLVKVVVLD